MSRLLYILSTVQIESSRQDTVQWKEDIDGSFTVQSCYKILNSKHIPYGLMGEFDKALARVLEDGSPNENKDFRMVLFY